MDNYKELKQNTLINNLKRFLSSANDEFRNKNFKECDRFLRLSINITNELSKFN